jgi:hypothetical protein
MKFQDFKQLTVWSNEQKGKEKIHFSLGESGKHYTFHFGCNSKIADFHITDERFQLDSPKRHLTLFKISHFRMLRLLVAIRKQMPHFMQWLLSQEVSTGFLKKKHILLLPIQNNGPFFNASYGKKFRLKRKDFDEDDFWRSLICPYELSLHGAGCFQAISTRYGFLKEKGFIYKIKISENAFRLFWVDSKGFLKVFEPIMVDLYRQPNS